MSNFNQRRFITTKSATILATSAMALTMGCDSGSNVVASPRAQLEINTAALTAPELESANGTFGLGCTDRVGAWSLEIAPGATLDNAPLSVVKNNEECELTLTSFIANGEEHLADPPFIMTSAYQSPSSAFSIVAGPIEFYGNAYLSSLAFDDDFVVHLLYSDDPNKGSASNTASYAVQSASVEAEGVPSPNYELDMGPMLLEVDSDNIVQTATGNATFTNGTVIGQDYVILTSMSADPTYAEIHDAFTNGTQVGVPEFDFVIPADEFFLVSEDLSAPIVRYVIVANTVEGVSSYQLYTVTFSSPASQGN
jgi:hypothetical protein